MTEAIYKVGDILEIESQYGMFSSDKKSRCLVLKCIKPGYEFIIYTLLVLKSDDSFTVIGVNQKDIILAAKRVGHIDISKLLSDDEENTEPDYAMFFTAATIAQAADLKNENDKIKKENKRLSNENRNLKTINDELRSSWIECCTTCKQTEENKKLMDENETLKRENEELRAANEKLAEAGAKYLKGMIEAAKHIHEALCNK